MNSDNFHSELLTLLKNAYDDIERTKQRTISCSPKTESS